LGNNAFPGAVVQEVTPPPDTNVGAFIISRACY